MRILLSVILLVITISSCKKETKEYTPKEDEWIVSAVDISRYPEIMETNPSFYDFNGTPVDFLSMLKVCGVNTVRLRLWVEPKDGHSGFEEVRQFSQLLKSMGFDIWLTVHYSDKWADPSQQTLPKQWQGVSYHDLTDSVYKYTQHLITELKPTIIQVGNEINNGFLHPHGHINQPKQFIELLNTAIDAIRDNSDSTQIMLHYAGIDEAVWFYEQTQSVDYDLIGLSYYPIWHGKDLDELGTTMQKLNVDHNKKVLIAETAYPFTLGWNDWTNNIVGLEEQLILPDYPASESGQRNFVDAIKYISSDPEYGAGFCYWGAELIAWKGTEATDGSPWENQALFDFRNQALPVLNSFKID